MEMIRLLAYHKAIDAIQASETMQMLGVSDYPHMKAESRKKLFSQLNKRVKPIKEKVEVKMDDLDSILGGIDV
jgi:hypothetical protein